MDHETDSQKLLGAVLAESAPADFREAMLAQTLQAVRRRRRARQTRNLAGISGAAILLALLMRPHFLSPVKAAAAKEIAPANYTLVRTKPWPDNLIISTVSFSKAQIVTSAATVTEVATTPGYFRLINDTELLALVGARPAILIRTGPDSEELVFANPQDQTGFPEN